MVMFRFTQWIAEGKKVQITGNGNQMRGFTFVDDIARGVLSGLKPLGYEIINLGGHETITINELLQSIEKRLGKKAVVEFILWIMASPPWSIGTLKTAVGQARSSRHEFSAHETRHLLEGGYPSAAGAPKYQLSFQLTNDRHASGLWSDHFGYPSAGETRIRHTVTGTGICYHHQPALFVPHGRVYYPLYGQRTGK
jgi:hypothetical protein